MGHDSDIGGHDQCGSGYTDHNGNPVGRSLPDRGRNALVDNRRGFAIAEVPADGNQPGGVLGKPRIIKMPGIVIASLSVQVLAWPHGELDLPGLTRQACQKFGLVDLSELKADVLNTDTLENDLVDTKPFDGRNHNSPQPSGWYPGATGFTRLFRQMWQLPRAAYFWSSRQVYLDDPVWLAVNGATWFFNETGDFETRVALGVVTQGKLRGGRWFYREDLEKTHLTAAMAVAGTLHDALRQARASEGSRIQRRLITGAYDTAPGGVSSGQTFVPAKLPSLSGEDEMVVDLRDGSLD